MQDDQDFRLRQTQHEEALEAMVQALPFRVLQCEPENALELRHRSKTPGISPLIIGNADDMIRVGEKTMAHRTIETRRAGIDLPSYLRAATQMRWPDSGLPDWLENRPQLRALFTKDAVRASAPSSCEPMEGWRYERTFFERAARAFIVLVPSDDFTLAPGYLHWGWENACPPPPVHIAALRSWRERFGADLISLSYDTMILRVEKRPADLDEAGEVALELFTYCPDLIDTHKDFEGAPARLARSLMISDHWRLWWRV